MMTNQAGEEIDEYRLFPNWGTNPTTDEDLHKAIELILEHLKMEIWSTNATKHGNRQLVLRKEGWENEPDT